MTIHEDISTLIKTGMLTISNKLSIASCETLANRCADVWTYFLGTILPYFQASFLPLRHAPHLQLQTGKRLEKVDCRKLMLGAFRNYVIYPLRLRLEGFRT